jgi:hypothetical protein
LREESERELAASTAQRDAITSQLANVRQMLATLGGGAPDALPAQQQPAQQQPVAQQPAPHPTASEPSASQQAAAVEPSAADATIVMQAIPTNQGDPADSSHDGRTPEGTSSKEPVRTN